jgi:hypothetical protein
MPQQWILPIQQEFKLSTYSQRRPKLPKHWERGLKRKKKGPKSAKSGQKS